MPLRTEWVTRQWPVYLVAVPCFAVLWSHEMYRLLRGHGQAKPNSHATANDDVGEPRVNLEAIRGSWTKVLKRNVHIMDISYARALRLALAVVAVAHAVGLTVILPVGEPQPPLPLHTPCERALELGAPPRTVAPLRVGSVCLVLAPNPTVPSPPPCRALRGPGGVPRGHGGRLWWPPRGARRGQ